jgi:hypothetical protein
VIFLEGADGQGGTRKIGKGTSSGKTTVMAPATNEINIDLGHHVVRSVQKRLLRMLFN